MIKTLIKCADLRSIPLSIATAFAGGAAAALTGDFDFFSFSLCVVFAALVQILGNFMTRYSNICRHRDDAELYIIDFSVGHDDPAKLTLNMGITFIGLVSVLFGFALIAMGGWILLIVGALIALYLYVLNFGPHPLTTSPWAIILVFIFFGPVGTISTTYIMDNHAAPDPLIWVDFYPSLILSFIVGFYACNTILFYTVGSYKIDIEHGKRTISTIFGRRTAIGLMIFNLMLTVALGALFAAMFPILYWWIPLGLIVIAAVISSGIVLHLTRIKDESFWNYQLFLNCVPMVLTILLFLFYVIYGAANPRHLQYF